jgi:lysophospholipase L1-like esterase
MNARGERILIFGDSLTQHASGQTVWDVNQGAQRAHSAPGDLLASLLHDQGAVVRTNALVSRSAVNFWTREPAQSLIAADLAWRPTKIVFVLGTNDVGLAPGADEAAFARLRDAYKASKAELWAIGPFTNRQPAASVAPVQATMRKIFGSRFIDGRPISTMISPGSDGIHYTPQGARLLALNMADALLSTSPIKPWLGVAIGAAVVIGAGLVYSFATNRRRGLAGGGGFRAVGHPRDDRQAASEIMREADRMLASGEPVRDIIARAAQRLGYNTVDDDRGILLVRYTQDLAARRSPARQLPRDPAKAREWLAEQALDGVEIVDGRRWDGAPSELVRSGYRQIACKSGLDRKGLARCWVRGLGSGSTDDDRVSIPLPFERKPQIPARWHKRFREERVPIDRMIATQRSVTEAGVKKYARSTDEPPIIYRTDDGRLYIADGHHRIVAAIARGEQRVTARIIDIGDPDDPREPPLPPDTGAQSL